MRYAFSALQHNSSTFVTQNAVTLYYQRANSARFPEVDVGSFSLLVQFPIYARKHVFVYEGINSPTDTSCLDVNQTFSYLWCVDWGFDLFQLVVRCHLNRRICERSRNYGVLRFIWLYDGIRLQTLWAGGVERYRRGHIFGDAVGDTTRSFFTQVLLRGCR